MRFHNLFMKLISHICKVGQSVWQVTLSIGRIKTTPLPYTIFIIGAPGAGKGTQSNYLVKNFGFEHLSYGDLMRQLRETGDPIVSRLETKSGTNNPKVPDDVGALLILRKITHGQRAGKMRWLVDGFPRRREQVDEWLKLFPPVGLALYLRCPGEVSLERVMERGRRIGDGARPEDLDAGVAARRIEEFYRNADLVVHRLREVGTRVVELDTNRSEEQIQRDLGRIDFQGW